MYFILIDDIEGERHYPAGDLLNQDEMNALCIECEVVSAHCFPTQKLALEWAECQDVVIIDNRI